ncbi:hypothetical protein Tco_1172314 [Tanacetum coccineum]
MVLLVQGYGKERKKKIKSLTKSLDNLHAEVARLSVALNQATVLEAEKDEEIIRLKITPSEFSSFFRGQFYDLVQKFLASDEIGLLKPPLVARTDYAFLNKILVDGSDLKMTDDTVAAKSGHAFVQGIFVSLEDVVELAEVGSGRASFGPNDVVVSLSVGEKGDGLVPSSAAGRLLLTPLGFRLSFSFLPFFVSPFSVRGGVCGMPENTCCSELGAN